MATPVYQIHAKATARRKAREAGGSLLFYYVLDSLGESHGLFSEASPEVQQRFRDLADSVINEYVLESIAPATPDYFERAVEKLRAQVVPFRPEAS